MVINPTVLVEVLLLAARASQANLELVGLSISIPLNELYRGVTFQPQTQALQQVD